MNESVSRVIVRGGLLTVKHPDPPGGGGGGKHCFIEFANSHGINTFAVTDFKLPM